VGAEQHPAWFLNLLAEPTVGVQVGTRRFTALARAASPAGRASLWAQMVSVFPLYDDYAQKPDREILIVLLTPSDGPC
jgi:deazaflavin-dependent oxidoreductase (nitroreductase family)